MSLIVTEAVRKNGCGRDHPFERPPRTDPGVRHYRTGLLPWVFGVETPFSPTNSP
jgi:hypothetical protein